MKRLLACVSLVALATTAANANPTITKAKAAQPPHVQPHPAPVRVAPADEYFGKLKMSILGIRNTIHDVGENVDLDQSRAAGLMNKADLAEDAMRDWEQKYPLDSWLPRTLFALERMYAKIDSDDGRARSAHVMQWLVHDFPKTWYGREGKKEIADHHVGHPLTTPISDATSGTSTNPGAAQPGASPAPNPQ